MKSVLTFCRVFRKTARNVASLGAWTPSRTLALFGTVVFSLFLSSVLVEAKEGKRPYEMDWANRFEDDVPPLTNFETEKWRVETVGSVASFEITNEQKIWGDSVAKLTYRMLDDFKGTPSVVVRPERPISLTSDFDAVSLWVYGNNWMWEPVTTTPRVNIQLLFLDENGAELGIELGQVNWCEWFLLFRRVSEENQRRLHSEKARFSGIRVTGGSNTEDRALFFDNLAIRKEVFKPLTFKPRAKRAFADPRQDQGTNTGEGTLPFPTRPETILPENKAKNFKNSVSSDNGAERKYFLKYDGPDGSLTYAVSMPNPGEAILVPRFQENTQSPWSRISFQWNDAEPVFPLLGGGVSELAHPQKPLNENWRVTKWEFVESRLTNQDSTTPKLKTFWKATAENPLAPERRAEGEPAETSAEICFTYSILGKSLILETESASRRVANVVYGALNTENLENAKVFPIPYYSYEYSGPNRPGAVCFRAPNCPEPLFVMGNTDWYVDNGSEIYGKVAQEKSRKRASFNGGVRYRPKTDGQRNSCYERFFLTVSPDFEEILPTLPNPESPWKAVTGPRHWRAHASTVRENDKKHWFRIHRHGMTEVVVTDHETCFRDGGESFTFRTKSAPGKGGDDALRAYSDFMNRELGFVYGPYNNFTDFAPVNEYWSTDMPSRTCQNQLQGAWARCYAPKPAWAVEYCEKLSPINQEKFNFRTAYCDVHTAVSASSRVDYDYRVPGAGTQAATFYSFGEIMLLQKKAWNGPVYSEGNFHFPYSGLTDGNYAQDQGYRPAENPWLVNLDLRKIHDLCVNFGMGNPGMFYPGKSAPKSDTPETRDTPSDRFFCATLAFGHPGFLALEYGIRATMRGYFNAQQLQARFTQVSADKILYCGPNGELVEVSNAISSGIIERSQVVVKYSDGTVVCANGSMTEMMNTEVDGRRVTLPPNGYAGWTADRNVFTFSGLREGKRCDYAESPEYVFIDGRGCVQKFARATGSGCGVCRRADENHWEIITLDGAQIGFRIPVANAVAADSAAVPVSVKALDFDRKELGAAEFFQSRGFTFVKPVQGAFSYLVEVSETATAPEESLKCDSWAVAPGETLQIQTPEGGKEFAAPKNAELYQRLWFTHGEDQIDFCVLPLAHVQARCDAAGNATLHIQPIHERRQKLTVRLGDVQKELSGEGEVTFTLPTPKGAEAEKATRENPLEETWNFEISSETLTQNVSFTRSFFMDFEQVECPTNEFVSQIQYFGKEPEFLNPESGAQWYFGRSFDCGEMKKDGFFAHPPYQNGQGTVWVEMELDLAKISENQLIFEASVGKKNGSDLGDGIFFRVHVKDSAGKMTQISETHVAKHEWKPISADLSQWKGQKIVLRLETNPGKNTAGDWGVWSEFHFHSLDKIPVFLMKRP